MLFDQRISNDFFFLTPKFLHYSPFLVSHMEIFKTIHLKNINISEKSNLKFYLCMESMGVFHFQ